VVGVHSATLSHAWINPPPPPSPVSALERMSGRAENNFFLHVHCPSSTLIHLCWVCDCRAIKIINRDVLMSCECFGIGFFVCIPFRSIEAWANNYVRCPLNDRCSLEEEFRIQQTAPWSERTLFMFRTGWSAGKRFSACVYFNGQFWFLINGGLAFTSWCTSQDRWGRASKQNCSWYWKERLMHCMVIIVQKAKWIRGLNEFFSLSVIIRLGQHFVIGK
jgi:hypothetical protein